MNDIQYQFRKISFTLAAQIIHLRVNCEKHKHLDTVTTKAHTIIKLRV